MKVIEGGFGEPKSNNKGPDAVLETIKESMENMDLGEDAEIDFVILLASGPGFGMATNMQTTSSIVGALEVARMTLDEEFKMKVYGS